MTVAIKGMDMPKSCRNCELGCRKFLRLSLGIRTGAKYSNGILPDCPLIALPEENKDMSWEELKETLKQYTLEKYKEIFILKIENEYIYFSSAKLQLFTFHINGDIITDDMYKIFKNAKYYFMFQIIKALIGDER